MQESHQVTIRAVDPPRDAVALRTIQMTDEQLRADYSSTPEHTLEQMRLYPEFGSKGFVVSVGTKPLDPRILREGTIVGFFILEPHPDDASRCVFKGLVIDQSFQSMGVGTRVLEILPALVAEEFPGARHLHLAVHPDNHAAIRIYSRRGFKPSGVLVQVGNRVQRDAEYVLDLSD